MASSVANLKATLEKATGGKVDPSSTSPNQSDDSNDNAGSGDSGDAAAGTRVEGLSEDKGAAAGDGRASERAARSKDNGASEDGGGRGRGRRWNGVAPTSDILLQARERLSETAASLTGAEEIENAVRYG